jgi:hypothetical protein
MNRFSFMDGRRSLMQMRYLATTLLLAVLLGLGTVPARGQGPIVTPRKPVLIVSGTALGTTLPGVLLVEELVIHNDGLVTLETAADTDTCRQVRRFVATAAYREAAEGSARGGSLQPGGLQHRSDSGPAAHHRHPLPGHH